MPAKRLGMYEVKGLMLKTIMGTIAEDAGLAFVWIIWWRSSQQVSSSQTSAGVVHYPQELSGVSCPSLLVKPVYAHHHLPTTEGPPEGLVEMPSKLAKRRKQSPHQKWRVWNKCGPRVKMLCKCVSSTPAGALVGAVCLLSSIIVLAIGIHYQVTGHNIQMLLQPDLLEVRLLKDNNPKTLELSRILRELATCFLCLISPILHIFMLVCFIKRSRTEAAATSAANAYAETRHITDTKIIIGSPTSQSATISSDAASQTTATMRWSSLSGLLIVSLSGLILQKAVNILQLILKHVGQPATLSVSVLPRDKEIPVNLQMPPISEPADEPALGETVMRTLKLTIPSFMGSPYHSPTRSPDTSLQVGLLELMSPCFQLLEAAVQTTCLLLIPHCHSNKRQNYEYQPHRQRNKIRSSCVKAHSFACQSIPTSDNLSFQIPQSSNRSSKPTAPLLLSKRVSALSPISHTTLRGHLLIVMVSINCALWVLLVLATLQLDCSPWGPPLSLTPRPTSTPHPTQIQSKTIPTDWPLESSNYAEFSQEAHHVKRFESKIWIGLARLGFAASSIFRFTSVSILIRDLGGVHAE